MNRLYSRAGAIALTSALCLITVGRLSAQTTAAADATKPVEEEVIELSPFVVSADEDQGYQAKDTLAGTRVRTELKDIASSISVVTRQFMQDTGSKNSADLLVYTTNTEVGGLGGNFSGNAGGTAFNESGTLLRPQQNTRVRGLDSADNTRDYFLTEIPWDGYIVDRVDLQRGPNSILFGVGSPAGIINTSINSAGFKNKNTLENRIDQFGSLRFSADINKVLIKDELSVRVALLDDHAQFRQEPTFNHDKRFFGAVRYSPKLFKDGDKTTFRANFERGDVNANRPRTIPPIDAITPWFYTGTDKNGNLNLNKFTYNPITTNPSNSAPYNTANRGAYPAAWLLNGFVGRQFWIDVVGYYGNNFDSNPTAYRAPSGSGRRGLSSTGSVDDGIGGLPGGRPIGINSNSQFKTASGDPAGGSYADRVIEDPTIFDFYNNLLDGNNSYQWAKWDAANVNFSQTFLNDRVGIEGVYDYQRYSDGQRSLLGGDNYKIGVDLMSHYFDGTVNPNVGRAYVANGNENANSMNRIKRDSFRFTAYAELKASDFLDGESRLTKILGRHVLTGLVSEDTKKSFSKNWATSAATPDFTAFTGQSMNLTSHFRSYNFVAYLTPNLSSRSSAAGINMPRVQTTIRAPKNAQVWLFDSTWNKPRDPADPAYVNPAAAYSYTAQNSGVAVNPVTPATVVSSQAENPANYVGWRNYSTNFLNADDGDTDALTFNAGKQENVISSQALTWQGYMFDGAFVPVFGWRKDKIENTAGSAVPDSLGIVNTNFVLDSTKRRIQEGESKSWGGVLHVPAKWTSFIPGNTKISAFFNRSENFKADNPRGDVFGNVISNPSGQTKEYGVVIDTLNDKLTVKATWYETKVANATLSGSNPLGGNSYFLWAMPAWGTAFVVNADQGIKGNNDGNSWAWNYAGSDDSAAPQFRLPDGSLNPAWQNHPSTVAEKKAIEAWRKLPLPQSFFNAYGNEVALIQASQIAAGNWTAADPIWNQKFDNQPIAGGNLAGFGSGPVFTVDTLSKGTEIELVARPTKNWNVTVNVSKTFATRSALAPTMVAYMNAMTEFLKTDAGNIRLWGSASNPLRGEWDREIVKPYGIFKSQEGSNAPEIAPWRFNGVTSYNFDHGMLKGSWIGGAYRWEDKRVLGYEYSAAISNLDIKKPLYGESDAHFDMWIGHSRKLSSRVNWRVQLNLRNVGEKTRLVLLSINPDKSNGYSRIQEGMIWQLTNTFEF